MSSRARRSTGDVAAASPLISGRALAGRPRSTPIPAPHTAAEVSALVTLLRQARASTIAIGHGRHATSCDTAAALTQARDRAGGTVLSTASWPARSASWLKPARQLIRAHPDTWVIAD